MRRFFNFGEDGFTMTDALIALGFAAILAFIVFRIRGIAAAPGDLHTLETAFIGSMTSCELSLSSVLQRTIGTLML